MSAFRSDRVEIGRSVPSVIDNNYRNNGTRRTCPTQIANFGSFSAGMARRPRRGREARAPSRLLPLDGAPDPCGHDIGNKDHPPRLAYPRLRTVRFSPASLESELEVHTIDGTRIRVTSVDELWRCARVDRVVNVMRPYLEVLA